MRLALTGAVVVWLTPPYTARLPVQYYSYVAPCLPNRFADSTGPFSIWLLLREFEFRALITAGHRPEDISVFGVTEKDGTINHLRFPSEGMLRSQLTALVVKVLMIPTSSLPSTACGTSSICEREWVLLSASGMARLSLLLTVVAVREQVWHPRPRVF